MMKRSSGVPVPLTMLGYPVVLTYRILTSCFDSVMMTYPGQLVNRYVGNISSVLAKCVLLWMVSTILLISSAVLYFTFHYSMMPTMLVTLPVHFQFSPCYGEQKQCAFPTAEVYLVDSGASPLLHPHVHYTFSLEMDMPESAANKDAGMFMVQLNLTSLSGKLVGSSARANILHYRSGLHRTLRTLVFSPLLLTEYAHEQQRLTSELFTSYLVQEDEPPTRARLELRSLTAQVYSARLRVHARLSGLRRIMYHHPLVSGVLGTAATFCSLAVVFLLVWLRSAELPVQLRSRLRRIRGGRAAPLDPAPAAAVHDVSKPGHAESPASHEAKGAPAAAPAAGSGAATSEPPVETLGSESGHQAAAGERHEVDGGAEDEAALRRRPAHSVVEY
ncbi:seipin-like isoform X2 [Amphibalanus amphitrite]|uniref:seipin-like isoform X2 n=1 Tax=Amphibalanus amphitrite TaxID=1232801 RepID=UPI001C9056D9|nr:seipin-like isoform X2 [Amphibalanus amphitrite]